MTQVVTVQTDFVDLNQMTQGLMERVHETHVILTGPDGIDEGEWVQFAVNLQDGTPGFAGLGRCVRSVDNAEARLPHQRFDLVLDSLQFDQHGQDVYQYILMSRHALQSDESAYDEGYADADQAALETAESIPAEAVSMDDVSVAMDEPIDEPIDAPMDEQVHGAAVNDDDPEDATRVESPRDIAAGLASATATDEAHALAGGDGNTDALAAEPSFEDDFAAQFASEPPVAVDLSETELATDVPEGPEAALPDEAQGAYASEPDMDAGEFGAAPEPQQAPAPVLDPGQRRFVYTQGLPFPSTPPRPDIDPSLRVTPAPRPSATASSTAPDLHEDDDPFGAHTHSAEGGRGVVNGHSVPPEYEERPAREAQDDTTDSTYPGP